MESVRALITDRLTIRADRDRYYYRIVTLFERHPEIILTLCQEARGLMPVMFDRLSWPSRVTENGLRRTSMAASLWPPRGSPTTATQRSYDPLSSPW